MELLVKKVTNAEDRRRDNEDKKPLFSKERHPRAASAHKEDWAFVEDVTIRENIAYQMQYLEFLVYLYNDYQIYLTVESLLAKNIMAVTGGVVEAALSALVAQESKKAGHLVDERPQFIQLIQHAYDMKLIDRELKDDFHELRKTRNLVHLNSIEYQEYSAYTIEEANDHLSALLRFQQNCKETPAISS